MAKRVLLISPYFPPHRAIGTKRAINFVQGVHGKEGWEVIVLASRPFNDNNDERLLEHIPEDVKVDYGFVGIFRPIIEFLAGGSKKKNAKQKKEPVVKKDIKKKKKSKQKGSLTPFDQYLWDVGSGIRAGKKLIKKYRPDVIWVNADPWSSFLVADRLSRKFDIPWVADLRDPWTIFERKMELRPSVTANAIRRYERKFFTSASKIVLNSETACKAYAKAYPDEFFHKFSFIRNAFNENLLQEQKAHSKVEPFIFGYYGGFRRFVPSEFLLKGFAAFVKKLSLDPSQVKIEIKGSVYSDFWDQVAEFGIDEFVDVEKEVKIDETVALLRSWDVLLLSAIRDFRWMISAKFYDYLFIRKPILAVSDNEELNRLIDETSSGKWAHTNQEKEITGLFESFYSNGKTSLLENEESIKPFGFEHQASLFRKTLGEVINEKDSR